MTLTPKGEKKSQSKEINLAVRDMLELADKNFKKPL